MRLRRVWWILCLLLWVIPLTVSAETTDFYDQQKSVSGADLLYERLPADTQELLEQLDLQDLRTEAYQSLSLPDVFSLLGEVTQQQSKTPLTAAVSLLAVLLLSAALNGLGNTVSGDSLRRTYGTVTTTAAAGLLLTPFTALLNTVWKAVDSVSVFMLSFVPVYGGILAANGQIAGATSYQTGLLTAAQLLTQGIRIGVLPLLLISLALGCTGSVADGMGLDRISSFLYKAVLWALGLFSTLFSGVLSVQQMVAAAGDTVSSRAMKFSLSSFVPVVGGVLSEAYSTVAGCAGLLRSTVGSFGLIATVLIILPPLVSCLLWDLILHAGEAVAGLFSLGELEKLCKSMVGAARVLIAVLAVFALLMVVSTTVMVVAGKGVTA